MNEEGNSYQRRYMRRLCDCLVCPATRYFVTFMLFLGMANSYIMRTNMSVAIVAMVNHSAISEKFAFEKSSDCSDRNLTLPKPQDGEFLWNTKEQGFVLSSFFYGYVLTQIPFGLLAKKYGALRFLGYGMVLNSVAAFFVPWAAYKFGIYGICAVRFIQGLGEGPIVPCSHTLLAKWIPPNERSRMGSAVYSGAQFGTIISMPISGMLAEYGFANGWPSIFYTFGLISLVWSVAFLIYVFEDPISHPKMDERERRYIITSIWGDEEEAKMPPIPYASIFRSMPFYAILIAHMGQNYGYETLMTELPTYMKQILHFSLKENGLYSALPYLAMWILSLIISIVADWVISHQKLGIGPTRKIVNTLGQYGPALALLAVSFTGCLRYTSLAILTIGVGVNGAVFSGFKVNHMDLSPHFAGVLMSITNCAGNTIGIVAPIVAGHIIHGRPTILQWRIVFFIAAGVYMIAATFFNYFASGERQPWDHPLNDTVEDEPKELKRKP